MGIAQANAIPITFPPGSTETEIEVPITNDILVEGTERFLGQIISGGSIADLDIIASTATIDIRDDGKLLFPTSQAPPAQSFYRFIIIIALQNAQETSRGQIE